MRKVFAISPLLLPPLSSMACWKTHSHKSRWAPNGRVPGVKGFGERGERVLSGREKTRAVVVVPRSTLCGNTLSKDRVVYPSY